MLGRKSEGFPDNFVKTNKYNVLNFLPINLFHQFSKMANFYFLIIVVGESVPTIRSSDSPASVMMALSMATKCTYDNALANIYNHTARVFEAIL